MSKEKILVTGSSGMVGSRFVELFPKKNLLLTPDEKEFDITDKKSVVAYCVEHAPQAILHFAAYTDVGVAETQRSNMDGSCWKINVTGTDNLQKASRKISAHLVHISTDMVFPGTADFPGPYKETATPPGKLKHLTWYGYTKLTAEKLLPESAALVRIIYPVRAGFPDKLDYLRKPLGLFDQGKLYPLFADQHVSISFADEVALGLQKILAGRMSGVYHLSSSDQSTPFKLVSDLLENARAATDAVKSSSLDDFLSRTDTPYRYPKFGGLDSSSTAKKLGIKLSSCKEIISELVRQGIHA